MGTEEWDWYVWEQQERFHRQREAAREAEREVEREESDRQPTGGHVLSDSGCDCTCGCLDQCPDPWVIIAYGPRCLLAWVPLTVVAYMAMFLIDNGRELDILFIIVGGVVASACSVLLRRRCLLGTLAAGLQKSLLLLL